MSRLLSARTSRVRLASALLACSALAGCWSEGPPTSVAPADPTLGTLSGHGAAFDGIALEVSAVWIGWKIEPVPGPRLDAVRIRVWNGTERPRAFDPRALRIETSDATQWARVVAGTTPELRPATLEPLADARGWVMFRVGAESRPIALVWLAAPGLALRIPLPLPQKPDR